MSSWARSAAAFWVARQRSDTLSAPHFTPTPLLAAEKVSDGGVLCGQGGLLAEAMEQLNAVLDVAHGELGDLIDDGVDVD